MVDVVTVCYVHKNSLGNLIQCNSFIICHLGVV